jgi:hypothetical protein
VKKLQQSLNFKRLLLPFDLVGKLDSLISLSFAMSLAAEQAREVQWMINRALSACDRHFGRVQHGINIERGLIARACEDDEFIRHVDTCAGE